LHGLCRGKELLSRVRSISQKNRWEKQQSLSLAIS
jgi:hypothetical protein